VLKILNLSSNTWDIWFYCPTLSVQIYLRSLSKMLCKNYNVSSFILFFIFIFESSFVHMKYLLLTPRNPSFGIRNYYNPLSQINLCQLTLLLKDHWKKFRHAYHRHWDLEILLKPSIVVPQQR